MKPVTQLASMPQCTKEPRKEFHVLLKTASRARLTACLPNTRFLLFYQETKPGFKGGRGGGGLQGPTQPPRKPKTRGYLPNSRSLQLAQGTRSRSPPGDPGTAPTAATHSDLLAQALGPRVRGSQGWGVGPGPPRLGRSWQPLAPRAEEKAGGQLR